MKTNSLIMFVMLLPLFFANMAQSQTNEIVSYYPFEGTLEDMFGPYDANMPEGDPNYVASGYDVLGQALYLDSAKW